MDKIDPKHFEAAKSRSTTHAVFDLLHSWHAALDQGKSVRVVFIDYSEPLTVSITPPSCKLLNHLWLNQL
jgi:hypothetical protein